MKRELKNYEVVAFPLISEKTVGMIETQNKVSFIVHRNAGKTEIKKAVEELYNVKVIGVNTVLDRKGRKKAVCRLDKKFKAQDVATKLGVI
ncbi:MAG TPA: 50S ribosomal protein L23 [archaeon]|nr:50S ribosomal protein L23 [archaeon]